jgi:molecular chaperone GrpE
MTEKPSTEPALDAPAPTDPADERTAAPEAVEPAERLQRERDDYYDRLLRKTAEFDNYRKRVDRERREQAQQALAALLEELLPVVDDFERALTVDAGDETPAYRKGVELIYAKLQDVLRKHGVRPIEALGADFDPNVHQAVMHEASPGHRDGEVIEELRKGYLIGDRLLRPAMVKVAKA